MSLTREDMLRELELLPVWQLRAPAPKTAAEPKNALEPSPVLLPESVSAIAEPVNLRIIVSDDANYLFLLEAPKTSEEETLLQNMLKAILTNVGSAKPLVNIGLQSISDLSTHKAKIIIAMGELAATKLLNLALQLEDLRGKLHQYNNLPVVVTYHPSHLLKNSTDKAKAWADLCMAKGAI